MRKMVDRFDMINRKLTAIAQDNSCAAIGLCLAIDQSNGQIKKAMTPGGHHADNKREPKTQ